MPDIPWFIYAMLLAPFGLIVVAAAVKYVQVRAASHWPSTPGKVVASHAETRRIKVPDSSREEGHRFEDRTFAGVTYEYTVSGQKLRNNRISIGEDLGNFQVAETLARYPVGTQVTVYYHSRHPREAVLERDLPDGIGRFLAIGGAVVLAVVFGSAIGLHRIGELVGARLAHPELSTPVVALGGFGAVAALFALALQRQAARARQWPVVPGTITQSGVEAFRGRPADGHARGAVAFTSQVAYAYQFNGVAYTGIRASLNGQVSSNMEWLVRWLAGSYEPGARVEVWVNPDNPAQATLDPHAGWGMWFLCAVAIGLWTVAFEFARRA